MGICNRPFSFYFTKRSPVWLGITVCFILFCFNIGAAFGLPNLAPTAYEYTFWTDAIIVSTTTGATTDSSPLTTNDNLYVSWAVKNKAIQQRATAFLHNYILTTF